MHYIQTGRS